jgi:hypothetical protein
VVVLAFVFAGVGVGLAARFAFRLAFALALLFAVLSQPGRTSESTARAMSAKNLLVILGKSSFVERERSSENIRAHENMAERAANSFANMLDHQWG